MKDWRYDFVTDEEVNEIMNLDHEQFEEYAFKMVEYYRQNPISAVYDVLGLKLTEYQKIIFKDAWQSKSLYLLMSRGGGKSFLIAIFCALWAILYPNESMILVGPSYRQSLMLYDKILTEVYNKSFSFKYEVKKDGLKRGTMDASITLQNESKMLFVPLGNSGDAVRGLRATFMVLDEHAQHNPEIIDRVLSPMMAADLNFDPENPKDGYEAKVIYSTSAYFQFNHAYKVFQDVLQRTNSDKDYYAAVIPYNIPLAAGLYNKKFIEKAKRELSQNDFDMEMGCKWIANNENSFISMQMWDKGIKYEEHLQPLFEGREGKEYILMCDIARSEGGDNTSLLLCEIRLNKLAIVRQMALNGQTYQYIRDRIREFCRDFNIVDIWMDRFGGGQAVEDLLAEDWVDFSTGKTYMPIVRREDSSGKGVPLLTFIVANNELNHEIGHSAKKYVEKGNFIFPVLMDRHEDKEMEMAYLDLIAVKKEVTNIQAVPSGNFHTFKPAKGSGMRKDRWTTFCYAAKYIQDKLERQTDDELYLEIF